MQSRNSKSNSSRQDNLLDSESVVELRELLIGFFIYTDSLALYFSSAEFELGIDLELQESNRP